ncbi:zinc-finger of mitochondrial splicing suppressor 51-domain-containing protein [Protomyces lactucae-debilis]|uniref:Zinc-finger of mitochondrial splicing suppressor 51-domain-containing protein n=1 Tax=Protomyces lactucae-debilis TaxID=2754530 RepID=A0A1Y2FU21_PROLT|nr:zinc-finger of mitochondrial splicing suppressor 51-domain-containing protein [Protomyces lactucae-debilis]ORY86195.1 zinc-finger of mitochondrial splicing suppressor 51-domain-containing protein [Protomyces lactucae-debilis]
MLKAAITRAASPAPLHQCRRTLFGFGKKKQTRDAQATATPLLTKDNLFHPLSSSPVPALRQRAAFIKRHAKSPTGKSIAFECPESGWPTHHDAEEYRADYEKHKPYIHILRQTNEDEHDLRSGRALDEFNFPGRQDVEEAINMSNWDGFLYTRQFNAVNAERSIRHVSKLLTYPLTIASVLHQGSPYRKRLTREGLRSLSALRATLHPAVSAGATSENLLAEGRPFRIFILGARAESSLPGDVWMQGLPYIFPDVSFHVHFIGPEAILPETNQRGNRRQIVKTVDGGMTEYYHPRLTFSTHKELYHTLHASQTFAPFDPYLDVFFLPCPGLGHPVTQGQWADTMPALLETKCGIFITGYNEEDMARDIAFIAATCRNEHDLLLRPGINHFASRKWDVSDFDPRDVIQNNWGVFGVRGKLYEATVYGSEELH